MYVQVWLENINLVNHYNILSLKGPWSQTLIIASVTYSNHTTPSRGSIKVANFHNYAIHECTVPLMRVSNSQYLCVRVCMCAWKQNIGLRAISKMLKFIKILHFSRMHSTSWFSKTEWLANLMEKKYLKRYSCHRACTINYSDPKIRYFINC